MVENNKGSIYECARRYAAVVYALSDIFGIDPLTMLNERREICSVVYMQVSREGIRLDKSVNIPQLPILNVSTWQNRRAS